MQRSNVFETHPITLQQIRQQDVHHSQRSIRVSARTETGLCCFPRSFSVRPHEKVAAALRGPQDSVQSPFPWCCVTFWCLPKSDGSCGVKRESALLPRSALQPTGGSHSRSTPAHLGGLRWRPPPGVVSKPSQRGTTIQNRAFQGNSRLGAHRAQSTAGGARTRSSTQFTHLIPDVLFEWCQHSLWLTRAC